MRHLSFRGVPAALAAIAAIGLASSAASAQIFTENFNSVSQGTIGAPGTVGGFSLTAGSVDVLNNFFGAVDDGRANYLDLDGSTGAGGLLQTSALSLGQGTVTLNFLLAGTQRSQTDSVTVSLGSLFTQSFTRTANAPFSLESIVITVPVTQTAVLSFNSTASQDNVGLLLDDVVLTQTSLAGNAAPEAGSATLAAMGLLAAAGVTVVRRRIRR